jgi:hypothetical protein
MTSGLAPGALAPASVGSRPLPGAAARPADHALAATGALCFKVFLAAQFLSLTRLFFSTHLGGGITSVASVAGVASVALLLPVVASYGLQAGSLFGTLVPPARLWVSVVLVVTSGLFVYGWLFCGFAINAVVHDFAPYLVVLAAVVLGSIRRAWADVDPFLVALFAAALVVNAVAMTDMTTIVSEADADVRAAREVLGYRTQWALAFWPLLFLTARLRSPRVALLVYAGLFFILGQQVLFQKRSPTVRVLLFMLIFVVVLPRLARRTSGFGRRVVGAPRPVTSEARTAAMLAGVGALALIVALASAPWLFRGQAAGLARRLSGQAYEGGAAAMLVWENERFHEARLFLRTVEPHEVVFGRGFGGYFVAEPGWGAWMEDLHKVASRNLHVGVLMPFFKGGLLLSLAYYSGLALALARGRRQLGDPFAAAAFFVLLLHALFLLQESWFSLSSSFDHVMVGLCMGYLLSFERRP